MIKFEWNMMTHFIEEIAILAPPQRVWEVISDVDHWNEWTPSIKSVKRIDNKPLSIGTRILIRQPKLPPALWKVTELIPGKGFTWVSTAPGLKVIASHSIEENDKGSRVILSIEISGILGGLWGAITNGITTRYIKYEAEGLKLHCENQN